MIIHSSPGNIKELVTIKIHKLYFQISQLRSRTATIMIASEILCPDSLHTNKLLL